jgi:hypothetical protein
MAPGSRRSGGEVGPMGFVRVEHSLPHGPWRHEPATKESCRAWWAMMQWWAQMGPKELLRRGCSRPAA